MLCNKNLPKIYCINLDKEPEKYEKIQKEFSNDFKIHRISAINAKLAQISGIKALFQTNIKLFNKVIKNNNNEKYVILIEDDIYKCDKFYSYWPKIFEFIKEYSNWDFISLDFLLNFEKPKLEVFNDLFYKIEKSRMTGFMIYNIDFLKKNIDYLSKCNILDMHMKHNKDFIQLIPKNLLIKQIVDKISNTANINTKIYENYYDLTERYLEENKPV